jgi:hypothetical protein
VEAYRVVRCSPINLISWQGRRLWVRTRNGICFGSFCNSRTKLGIVWRMAWVLLRKFCFWWRAEDCGAKRKFGCTNVIRASTEVGQFWGTHTVTVFSYVLEWYMHRGGGDWTQRFRLAWAGCRDSFHFLHLVLSPITIICHLEEGMYRKQVYFLW